MVSELELELKKFVRTHDAPDPAYGMDLWDDIPEVATIRRKVKLGNVTYFVNETVFTKDYVAPLNYASKGSLATMSDAGVVYRKKGVFVFEQNSRFAKGSGYQFMW